MAELKLDDAIGRIDALIAKNNDQKVFDRPAFDSYVEAQIAKSLEEATSGKSEQSTGRLKMLTAAIATAKASWDSGASTVTFVMMKDPWQLLPNVVAVKYEVDLSALPKAGDSNIHTTSDALLVQKRVIAKSEDAPAGVFLSAAPLLVALCTIAKASEKSPLHARLAKSEEGRSLIAKAGEAKQMLTSIASMFGIAIEKDADLLDYELRWQIGDVIRAIQSAAEVEMVMTNMSAALGIAKSDATSAAKVEKAEPMLDDGTWPQDLASASYDESKGVFKDTHGRSGKRHAGWDETEKLDV